MNPFASCQFEKNAFSSSGPLVSAHSRAPPVLVKYDIYYTANIYIWNKTLNDKNKDIQRILYVEKVYNYLQMLTFNCLYMMQNRYFSNKYFLQL